MCHTWQPFDVGLDVIIATRNNNIYSYFLHNANKDVMQEVLSNGILHEKYGYTPFGKSTSIVETNIGFSSESKDFILDIINYNYRYYYPLWGRWTKRDLFEERGGTNLYTMINNNTVNNFDILGLKCETKKQHMQLAGGILTYYGIEVNYEKTECDCCENGIKGKKGIITQNGTISVSAGAGFDVDFGDLDFTINWPWIGPVEHHLAVALHLSITSFAINHTFSSETEYDDCKGISPETTRFCWKPSLDCGMQSINVGNRNFGLIGEAYARFEGKLCILISPSGVSIDEISMGISANVRGSAFIGNREFRFEEGGKYFELK